MNITIRQRILLSFAVILAVMLVMGGIAIQRLSRIETQESLLRRDAIPGMQIAGQVLVAWYANYSQARAHVIADDDTIMLRLEERLRANRATFDNALDRYETTITTPEDRQNYEALKRGVVPYFASQSEAIRLSKAHDPTVGNFMRQRMDPALPR